MRKLVLIISIISMTYTLSARDIKGLTQEEVKEKTKEIVINKAMLEKFNNANWAENNIDFATLFATYSFSDIKIIVKGYKEDNLELSEPNIKKYLTTVKSKMTTSTELSKEMAAR